LTIFRGFRRLLDALDAVAAAIRDLATVQRDAGPALLRLEALELHRAQFQAEMEGLLLRAEGKLKAASNAEARERQMKKSYEKDVDPFDEGGEAGSGESPILPNHVAPSETERMQAMHLGLAPNNKSAALIAKWARGP